MKVALVLTLVCVAAAYGFFVPQKLDAATDHFKCLLCENVCEDTESWIGTEEGDHEAAQIARCDKLLGSSVIAKLICEDFLKNDLDDIIKHMTDPNTEKKDCTKDCKDINFCKNKN